MESRNLETVVKELTDYLHTPKNPLAPPSKYNESTIQTLMQALQPYDLTKAELLMIINLRPDNAGVLDCIVEELDQRFSEEVQEEMLRVVVDVLGAREEDGEDGEDGEGEKGGFSEGL
ncbi:MAG: hypothetical protein M1830_009902 [Pleopsidium flavum]|nr:MAG: hypothetical protein M1830_009902 [Pleopsidium flavum]